MQNGQQLQLAYIVPWCQDYPNLPIIYELKVINSCDVAGIGCTLMISTCFILSIEKMLLLCKGASFALLH